MAWRIRHSIAKRRGRAMVASILAVLFLVLAPTAGAAIVSGINSKLPQVSLLELDDQIDERDIIFGDARNGSTITWNGANYSTDIYAFMAYILDENGTLRAVSQSITVDSQGRLFFLADYGGYTPSPGYQRFKYVAPITAKQLKDANLQKIRLYIDSGTESQVNVKVWVSSPSATVTLYEGLHNISENSSWIEIPVDELDLLAADSKLGEDSSLQINFGQYDSKGDFWVNEGVPVLFDVELIGPESGGVAKNWLNYYFLLGGLVGLVGAVFATPYVNIRSFHKMKHEHTKQFRKNKKRRFRRRRRR